MVNRTIIKNAWSKPIDGAGVEVHAWEDRVSPTKHRFTEHVAWAPAQQLVLQLGDDEQSVELNTHTVPDEA